MKSYIRLPNWIAENDQSAQDRVCTELFKILTKSHSIHLYWTRNQQQTSQYINLYIFISHIHRNQPSLPKTIENTNAHNKENIKIKYRLIHHLATETAHGVTNWSSESTSSPYNSSTPSRTAEFESFLIADDGIVWAFSLTPFKVFSTKTTFPSAGLRFELAAATTTTDGAVILLRVKPFETP